MVDNICGDWDFEDGGNPVIMNRIMAAADPVLCDAFMAHLMGYELQEIPYIQMAADLGAGLEDWGTGRVSGTEPSRRKGSIAKRKENRGTPGRSRGSRVLQCLLWISDTGPSEAERGRITERTEGKNLYRTGIPGKDRKAGGSDNVPGSSEISKRAVPLQKRRFMSF